MQIWVDIFPGELGPVWIKPVKKALTDGHITRRNGAIGNTILTEADATGRKLILNLQFLLPA